MNCLPFPSVLGLLDASLCTAEVQGLEVVYWFVDHQITITHALEYRITNMDIYTRLWSQVWRTVSKKDTTQFLLMTTIK